VYRIGESKSAKCRSYLIDGGDEYAIVDPGRQGEIDHLLNSFGTFDLDEKKIRHIINTHCHNDHAAGDKECRDRFGAQIVVPELDAQAVEEGDDFLTGTLCAVPGVGASQPFPPCPVDHRLRDGDAFRVGNRLLRAVHAPGHTPGSAVLLLETDKRLAFVGDVCHADWPRGKEGKLQWGWISPIWGSNIEDYLATFERLQTLDVELAVPGHGDVYADLARQAREGHRNLKERIERYPFFY
jgi:glyoxylase-like metal-dependent hydrolase (beta-lactamase superfamily II)